MKQRTPQEIAKDLYNINWVTVQCDDVHENEQVRQLLFEIEQLPHKQGLRLILFILEAKECIRIVPRRITENGDYYDPFGDMSEFKYINGLLDNFPTDELEEWFKK